MMFKQIIRTFPDCREVIRALFSEAKHLEYIELDDIFFILEQPLLKGDSDCINLHDQFYLINIVGLYAYHPLVKWQSGLARLPNFYFRVTVCRKAMQFALYGTEIHKITHPEQISQFFNDILLINVDHAAFVLALFSLHLDELMRIVRQEGGLSMFPGGMPRHLDHHVFVEALRKHGAEEARVMRKGQSSLFFDCIKYLNAADVSVVLQQDSVHYQLQSFFIKHYVSKKDFFTNTFILKLINDLTGKANPAVFQVLINCVSDPSDLLQQLQNREQAPWLRDLDDKKYQSLVLGVAVCLLVAYQSGACLRGNKLIEEALLSAWAKAKLLPGYAELFMKRATPTLAQFMFYLENAEPANFALLNLFCPNLSPTKLIDLLVDSDVPVDDITAQFFAQKLLPTTSPKLFADLSDKIRLAPDLTRSEQELGLQRLWHGAALLQGTRSDLVIKLTASEYRRLLIDVNYARGKRLIPADCHFAVAIDESWYIRADFYQQMMHLRSGLNAEMATLRRAVGGGCLFFDGDEVKRVNPMTLQAQPVTLDDEALVAHWKTYVQM